MGTGVWLVARTPDSLISIHRQALPGQCLPSGVRSTLPKANRYEDGRSVLVLQWAPSKADLDLCLYLRLYMTHTHRWFCFFLELVDTWRPWNHVPHSVLNAQHLTLIDVWGFGDFFFLREWMNGSLTESGFLWRPAECMLQDIFWREKQSKIPHNNIAHRAVY